MFVCVPPPAGTLCATYNNIESVKALFEANKGEIAGVILEPVVGNSGFIPPTKEFLEELRELTTAEGALLCFDEVMTGFRIAKGCAQEYWGVTPDLTTMGKVKIGLIRNFRVCCSKGCTRTVPYSNP